VCGEGDLRGGAPRTPTTSAGLTDATGLVWYHIVPVLNGSQMTRDALSVTFAALADPTRRAILAQLRMGEASVAELAEPFALTPRAVSKHIAVLEAAGLVTRGRNAQRRPSRIRVEPLAGIDVWLESYRMLWNQRFDRMAQNLARQQKETRHGGKKKRP